MADSPRTGEPAGPGGRVHRGWPGPDRADGTPPVLDLAFGWDTLHLARTKTRACVRHAGLADEQAENVVLAVHELAANAILHGGGTGRLRLWALAGALHCQVDNGDVQTGLNTLPCEPGHGLWVVRQVSDHMQSLSGPTGTSVLVRFDHGSG